LNNNHKKIDADAPMMRTLASLWPYMWPKERPDLKTRVLIAIGFLVIAKLVTLLIPYFFKWATDAFNGTENLPGYLPTFLLVPIAMVLAYGAARIVSIGFTQLRDAFFAKVGQYAVRQLAYRTFVHLHKLSLRFHLQRRTGGLSRVIERGTLGIESIIRFAILSTIPTALEFLFTAIVLAWTYDWRYVIVCALTIWAYTVFTVKASDWRIQIRRDMNNSNTEANSKNIDALLNYETVKYFGNESHEANRFDSSMAKYEQAAIKTNTSLGWLNFGQTMIFTIGMTVCMVMSAQAVQAGTQTIGDFVFINALLLQLSIPLNFIGFVYREIRQGLADLEAMFDLLNVDEEIQDADKAKDLNVENGEIEFNSVHFHYDEERPILKGVSFKVPAGKTVAIVGPSGAGKSTISRLLFRFYDVKQGEIKIDGQDLRQVTQSSLRHHIGMVPQDTVLFNDTVAYNIKYGRLNATDDEVKTAADLAQISDFIKTLPNGFDTEVGERGLKLSGGEKQRVAIARTLLKAPPILVLDEATSALDSQTEQEIQHALDVVSQNRTTLVIAHRLSTIINADEIIVLKAGEITERGTHQELMTKGELYADMWNRQREAIEAEERLLAARKKDELGILSRKSSSEE
jgi:ATP-binding cassette subfamily B protein